MLGNIITKIVIWLVHNAKFSTENRIACTNVLLEKLKAIPSRDIVNVVAGGQVYINGKAIDAGKMSQLKRQAQTLLDDPLRQLVREEVSYRAVKLGVHKANNLEEIFFSKAAIYQAQEEDTIYEQLAQK